MLRPALCLVAPILILASCSRTKTAEQGRFDAPPGFSVELVAPASQVGSLVALTFDSLGRPVVAKERQHPVILIDQDGDGRFETEKVFSDQVNTIQGMWFDGRTLYVTGNNAEKQVGFYKLTDTDGDDRADTIEQLSTFTGGMGEHGPHAIRQGPDGVITVMLGNHTGVPEPLRDPNSPLRGLKEWQLLERYMDARGHAAGILAPGGVVARFNPNQKNYTTLFGGFRNAYDFAYNAEGEIFTFDSDMEWDINMPWYRDTRTVHAIPGADYGWRTGSGKFPAYFFDTLPPLRDEGRGSPVGVEFYQHYVYPKQYFDAFLSGDWSRGRILFTRLRRQGATYAANGRVTEFVHGEPLNVTDLEVGPDGFVYFTMGGRDTEGGLYRVRYTPGFWEEFFPAYPKAEGILKVVRQPQPLSAWGTAALLKTKQEMGDRWAAELDKLARDVAADPQDRVQAVHLLQRLGPKPRAELLRPLAQDRNPAVRAAAIYVVGQHGSPRAKAIAVLGLKDTDPLVRRRAAEAIVRMGLKPEEPSFAPIDDIYNLLKDGDRFVRYAGRLALERTPKSEWRDRVLNEKDPRTAMEGLLALVRTGEAVLEPAVALLRQTSLPVEQRLAALRLFSIVALESQGDVRKQVAEILLPQFPAPDERLNRELARVLAYTGSAAAIQKILDAMPKEDANQQLQIHYAYCLREIKEGWTPEQKQTLVRWFQKASKWRGGASFTGFINLMFDSSLRAFTDEEKQMAYRRIPEFAPAEDYKAAMAKRMQETGWVAPSVLSRSKGVQAISPQEIYEFQMFDPMTLKAKPEKGAEIFEKECASCHRFGSKGNDFGPDLTTLNARFKKKDILEAILYPSKTISDQYESTIVDLRDGDIINGLLVKEDDARLQLKTAEVQRPIEVPKAQVKARRKSNTSIMPENLLDGYSQDQIAALIAYLQAGAR